MDTKHPDYVQPVRELLDKVHAYNPNANLALIEKAYEFGKAAHAEQRRKSGELYFNHPIEVAKLLTEIRIDDTAIITALLHDTIEDTPVTFDDVAREFSPEIALLVNGVTKLTKLQLEGVRSEEAENLRKLLLAMSKDVRVILVKLADRLHNMLTIKSMSPEKQLKKATETMDIYAPLAGRMGMQYLRDELEDSAFKVINPSARDSIMRKFITMRKEKGNLLPEIIEVIEKLMDDKQISCTVTGREKRPYSIWRKIEGKGEGFEKLSDIYGFRIITNEVEDCYRALGAIHQKMPAVPGRFKDYISQPKSNGYRSIHTTVLGTKGQRIEIQIRTQKMHVVAESGIAAHWAYKDGKLVDNPYKVDPTGWLTQLKEGLLAHDDDEEFMENFRLEMYADKCFVFSPKGLVVKLPRGATPIDFAYAIHTDLGNHAVGAIVDGNRVPLHTQLRNGQTVKIIRGEASEPNEQWADFVKTGRARIAIKRSFSLRKKAHDISLGRSIAEVSLTLINKSINQKTLDSAAKELEYANADELLAALGRAEISGKQMVAAVYPELSNLSHEELNPIALPPLIKGNPAFSARPCPICNPVPGDRIIGLAKRGEGIRYHIVDCDELAKFESNDDYSWIDLKWPKDLSGAIYTAQILVTMVNDAGILGRICTIIGENHSNIERLNFVDRRPDFYKVHFEITVRDQAHLQNILKAVKLDSAISEAVRFRPKSEPKHDT